MLPKAFLRLQLKDKNSEQTLKISTKLAYWSLTQLKANFIGHFDFLSVLLEGPMVFRNSVVSLLQLGK
jgi:hypothetical protein